MTSVLFEKFFDDLLVAEGGYSNNPNDSGGETRFGITEKVARANGYEGPMKELPVALAKKIYKAKYWDVLLLDEIRDDCPTLCLKLADIGVNLGVKQAAFFLQRLLNVMNNRGKLYPEIKVDGQMGPSTISVLKKLLAIRGRDGERVLVRALNCMQGMFYLSLAERREKDEAFIYGWFLNRVS